MAESDNNGKITEYQETKGGKFAAGNPGKPKGAVTKVSIKVREVIISFLERNVDNIQKDFDTLKPREKLQFVADILPYAAPKLSSIQTENETNISGGITIRWEDPDLSNPKDKGSAGEL